MGHLTRRDSRINPVRWSKSPSPFPAATLVLFIILGLIATYPTGTPPPGANLLSVYPQSPQNDPSPIQEFPIPTQKAGPEGITVSSTGDFWFTEYQAGKIGEYTPSNNTFHEFQVPETNAVPTTVAVDKQGMVWFTDQKNDSGSVWMFNPSTTIFTQHRTQTPNSTPLFVLPDSQNNIWFTELTGNKLGVLTYPSYTMTEYTLPTSASGPAELSLQPGTPLLWITETYANKIASFDLNSQRFQEYSPSISLKAPVGIVADNNGNLWMAEHGGSSLVEFTPSTSTFKKYPTSVPLQSGYGNSAPATIAIDSRGRLWSVEHFANKVARLDPSTPVIDEFAIPAQGLAYSLLNTLDRNGNFWFTEFDANKIGTIPSGAKSPILMSPPQGQTPHLDAGQTLTTKLTIATNLTVPVQVSLNVSSSFTPTGQTSPKQVSLNPSSIALGPAENGNITVSITPDLFTASGLYGVGVSATYGNTTSVGITFVQVRSLLDIILTIYLPIIIVAVLAAFTVAFFWRKRRKIAAGRLETSQLAASPTFLRRLVTLVFSILATAQLISPAYGKCPGLPFPPPGSGQPDYVPYVEVATLGFFTIIIVIVAREQFRKRRAGKENGPDQAAI